MNRKTLVWLQRELPHWQDKGWISPDIAKQMERYYQHSKDETKPSYTRLLIVLFGIILAGIGIFLLLAGYWHSFSPNGRFDWLMAWTIITLIIVGLTLWRTSVGSLFREGVGLYYFLAMLLSLGLMGDTYPLGHAMGLYLLLTIVLSIVAVYMLRVTYLMGVTLLATVVWCMSNEAYLVGLSWVWLMIASLVPYYVSTLRSPVQSAQAKIFASWALVVSIYVAFFFTLAHTNENISIIFSTMLAVITYVLGHLSHSHGFWALPFRSIGILGLLYVIFMGTFTGSWQRIADMPSLHFLDSALVVVSIGLVGYLSYLLYRRKNYIDLFISALVLVVVTCAWLAYIAVNPLVITVLFNLYIVIVAAAFAIRGSLSHQVGAVNSAAMAVIVMVLARFFDPGFTFVERGISFIVVGVILLLANMFYLWNKQRVNRAYNRKLRMRQEKKWKQQQRSQRVIPPSAQEETPMPEREATKRQPPSELQTVVSADGGVPSTIKTDTTEMAAEAHSTPAVSPKSSQATPESSQKTDTEDVTARLAAMNRLQDTTKMEAMQAKEALKEPEIRPFTGWRKPPETAAAPSADTAQVPASQTMVSVGEFQAPLKPEKHYESFSEMADDGLAYTWETPRADREESKAMQSPWKRKSAASERKRAKRKGARKS